MKIDFDPLFGRSKDSLVYFYADTLDCTGSSADMFKKCLDAQCTACVVPLDWSRVQGTSDDSYDEAFLANLRMFFKTAEALQLTVFLKPIAIEGAAAAAGSVLGDEGDVGIQEQFIAAFAHTARRIKDCKAVAGFVLPLQESLFFKPKDFAAFSELFKQSFQKKHPHYIFI